MTAALTRVTETEHRLATLKTVEEAKELRDQADALVTYTKRIGAARRDVNRVQLVKVLAERAAGDFLRAKPRKGNQFGASISLIEAYKQAGVAEGTAKYWQTIATLSEAEVRALEAVRTEHDQDFSSAVAYQAARKRLGFADDEDTTEATLWQAALRHLEQFMDDLVGIGNGTAEEMLGTARRLHSKVSAQCTS